MTMGEERPIFFPGFQTVFRESCCSLETFQTGLTEQSNEGGLVFPNNRLPATTDLHLQSLAAREHCMCFKWQTKVMVGTGKT